MAAEIRLFPCLTDNFGYLIHDPASKATASVDAPEAAPIIKALEAEGWTVMRFWEHDIKNDPEKLAGRVKRIVRKSVAPGRRP